MKMQFVLIVFVCFWINVVSFNAHALFKSAKVTLVAIDEEGMPLEGVDAGVAFEKNTGWGTDVVPQDKFTDGEGKATFSGQCNGHIAYGAEKEGYYPSYYDYNFKDLGTFGWEPWNPKLKVVMRKIENQVPMYVRDSKKFKKSIAIPVIGMDVGFDLIAYDWVAPYGNGQYEDLILHLEKKFINMREYNGKLVITFSNKNDGIIKVTKSNEGSIYKLIRFAPSHGYSNKLVIKTSQGPKQPWVKGFNSNDSYILRIRSEVIDGKVVKAMYGKIIGPIFFEPRIEPTEIYFNYFINPDGTRNLEHNPDKNLFIE